MKLQYTVICALLCCSLAFKTALPVRAQSGGGASASVSSYSNYLYATGTINSINDIINIQLSGSNAYLLQLTDPRLIISGYPDGVVTGGLTIGGGVILSGTNIIQQPTAMLTVWASGNSCYYENQTAVLSSCLYNGQANSYQWQVSTNGITWRNIGSQAADAGIYSGANDATLFIYGLTTGMNAWKYRATAEVTGNNSTQQHLESAAVSLAIQPSVLKAPWALAIDSSSDAIYVSDYLANAIWKITGDNTISLYAGSANSAAGAVNSTGTLARFNKPTGLAWHEGKLYVADTDNHAIRVISQDGKTSTFAGVMGEPGYQEGMGANARFQSPQALTIDSSGTLYVADTGNNVIRKIAPDGTTSHVAGSKFSMWGSSVSMAGNATMGKVGSIGSTLSFDTYLTGTGADGLAVSGSLVSAINSLSGGGLGSLVLNAGQFSFGGIDGITGTLLISNTLTVDSLGNYSGVLTLASGSTLEVAGNVYNNRISQDAQNEPAALSTYYFNSVCGITLSPDGQCLYVADSGNYQLCTVRLSDGAVTPLDVSISGAGNDKLGFPGGLRFDKNHNLYIADTANSRIVEIASTGSATVCAGSPNAFGYGDGSADAALFFFPTDVAINSTGNLYVADTDNAVIRKITTDATVSTLTLELAADTNTGAPTNADTGSGGGGAPSAWYLLALAAVVAMRLRRR